MRGLKALGIGAALSKKELEAAFKFIDRSGDGSISYHELGHAAQSVEVQRKAAKALQARCRGEHGRGSDQAKTTSPVVADGRVNRRRSRPHD